MEFQPIILGDIWNKTSASEGEMRTDRLGDFVFHPNVYTEIKVLFEKYIHDYSHMGPTSFHLLGPVPGEGVKNPEISGLKICINQPYTEKNSQWQELANDLLVVFFKHIQSWFTDLHYVADEIVELLIEIKVSDKKHGDYIATAGPIYVGHPKSVAGQSLEDYAEDLGSDNLIPIDEETVSCKMCNALQTEIEKLKKRIEPLKCPECRCDGGNHSVSCSFREKD